MRLLIELKSSEDNRFQKQYNAHLQGLIYNELINSPFESLHDQQGAKPFTFSNLFPFQDLKKGDIRTFIISSPSQKFIGYLFDIFKIKMERQTIINIGYMTFKINYLKEIDSRLPEHKVNLITGTPITIRIPSKLYRKYGYESVYDNFTYWKNEQPINIFVDQVKMKLVCKYSKYNTQTLAEYHECVSKYRNTKLFDTMKFRKQVCNPVIINGYESPVIGTCWEFGIENLNGNRQILQFAYDSGLGERNSLGFGFMNLQQRGVN